MKSSLKALFLTAALFLPATASLHAALLSVDFNADNNAFNQTGFSAFNVASGTGNPGPISNTFGPLTVSVANGTNFTTFASNTGSLITRERGAPTDNGSFTYGNIYRDFIIAQGTDTVLNLQIQGLNANTAYSLIFYVYDSAHNDGTSTTLTTQQTITNRTGGASTNLGSNTYTATTASTSFTNNLFATTVTATTNAAGTLWFSFDKLPTTSTTGANSQAILNGFEINPIPEPTTLLLSALSLTALALRRRN